MKYCPSIETEHEVIKKQFRLLYESEQKGKSHYSAKDGRLAKDMERYKKLDSVSVGEKRRKCIIIEDSYKKYTGIFEKTSSILSARNPMRKDTAVVDYDMSSEDEWNEENGEDLENRNLDEEEEDEEEKMLMEEVQEEGFIVSDGYLSASELQLSQSECS